MSSDAGLGVGAGEGGDDDREDLAGDVALEHPQDVLAAVALGAASLGVVPGPGVVDEPDVGDGPQRVVRRPVTTAVEPVPLGLPGARFDRADSAERGEGGVAGEPVGVAAGGDEQLRGAVDADAGALEQLGRDLLDEDSDLDVEVADFVVEVEPAPAEAAQRALSGGGGVQSGAGAGPLPAAAGAQPQAQVLGAVDEQRLDLVGGLGLGLDGAVAAMLSARSAPTWPSRSLGTAVASPASTARAAASASTGSLLPLRRRRARSGRLTSSTLIPAACRQRASW